MPVEGRIPQETVNYCIDQPHVRPVRREEGQKTTDAAGLGRPEDIPVIPIETQTGDAPAVGQYRGKGDQKNGEKGLIVAQFLEK